MTCRLAVRLQEVHEHGAHVVVFVLQLLLTTLPNIVVLTLPMSLLFGTLIAVGRLSSDSELIAMRASGLSLLSLYRPILLLSGLLTLLNIVLMVCLVLTLIALTTALANASPVPTKPLARIASSNSMSPTT